MNSIDNLDELLVCRLDNRQKAIAPCTVVIFGASGDLTARKLMPALYHLAKGNLLPSQYRIIGFARREKTNDQWREELKEGIMKYSKSKVIADNVWIEFSKNVYYCQGDIDDITAYNKLKDIIQSVENPALRENRLFYLAISPSQFVSVTRHLNQTGLLTRQEPEGYWQRLVVEKPFGHDLKSAEAINQQLTEYLREKQIFRIDHYLGKETVQNIMMFRFSNAIFEPLWNRQHIDHVQITVSETLGVGSRGGYYEEAGALRDCLQNHLLIVMALIGMEPPVSLESESIRDEMAKLLKTIRLILPVQAPLFGARGQYTAGTVNNQMRIAYRQEQKVDPLSKVETYAALRLFVDNWRWSGTPFYLRTGKSMALSASEIRVQFRPTPHVLFAAQCGPKLDVNSITLRLQPQEGITLRFNGKIPGSNMQIRPVRMQFSYESEFGAYTPEAYERLLLDAMVGDSTLFIRRDLAEIAWQIVDPFLEYWSTEPLTEDEFYPAGSWGPNSAELLMSRYGHAWKNPGMETVG